MSLPCGDKIGRAPATPRLRVEERHGRSCEDVKRTREMSRERNGTHFEKHFHRLSIYVYIDQMQSLC